MNRIASLSRPARAGAATLGVAGALLLAGCASGADTASVDTPSDASSEGSSASTPSSSASSSDTAGGGASSSAYTDGTYTADGTYNTPESVEQISVTVTLENDVVTAVDVEGDPQRPESERYQSQFIGGIADEVVGVNIDDISVDRVAGSSLTSGGFNDALEQIRADAAA
jgi:uncharacterized protein with FMN-binding domain